ncbi:hypothetical protein [Treponema sp. R80B11-R83G3]
MKMYIMIASAIKTADAITISDIETSLISAVYGLTTYEWSDSTFRLWRNVVNRHRGYYEADCQNMFFSLLIAHY